MTYNRICVVPKYEMWGPGTFIRNLKENLKKRGVEVIHDLDDINVDSILVVNATRSLLKLRRQKKRGIYIVQRLGSPSVLERYLNTTWKEYVFGYIRNYMVRWVRSKISDVIIYQSHYVKEDWEREHDATGNRNEIIYNGVDVDNFANVEKMYQSPRKHCLISVEGQAGLDPFDIVINLGKELVKVGLDFEILMFGIPFLGIEKKVAAYPFIKFMGHVSNSQLAYFYKGAEAYILTDIIAAGCPNSVLESLSCGTPVLSYDAGVISEMLNDDSGILVKGKGDPWKGQSPGNFDLLAEGAIKIFSERERFRKGSMDLARERYNFEQTVESYLKVLYP